MPLTTLRMLLVEDEIMIRMMVADMVEQLGHAVAAEGGGRYGVNTELPIILVVEDETLLQDMVQEALDEGGFRADIIASGEEVSRPFKPTRANIGR